MPKFTVEVKPFREAADVAALAVARSDAKPALRSLLAVASEDGTLDLAATDLEVGIRMRIPATVEESGPCLLLADKLRAVLKCWPEGDMAALVDAAAVTLRSGADEFELPSEDPAAFPDVAAFAEDAYHEIPSGVLRTLVRRTRFAAAEREHARFGATTGVLWELEDGQARLVATDGRRCAVAEAPAAMVGGHAPKGQPVVPSRTMALLERCLGEDDAPARVAFRGNDVALQVGETTIVSRLVEGRFPAWERVLPQKAGFQVQLTVDPYLAALRKARVLVDAKDTLRVAFAYKADKLTLTYKGQASRSRVELAVPMGGQKGLEVLYDVDYHIEMLALLDPGEVLTFSQGKPSEPGLFTSADGSYKYVAVPLIVRDDG